MKLSAVIFIFESDLRTPNFSFSPPFMHGSWTTMDIFWVRFSDPKFFFQSTISGLWTTMDSFLSPIFGPKIFLWAYQFLDCGRRGVFFVSRIRRPQIKFFVFRDYLSPTDLLISFESCFSSHISADLTTPFESNSRTQVNRSIICVKFPNNSRWDHILCNHRMSNIYFTNLHTNKSYVLLI